VYDGVESRLHMRSDIWSEMLVGGFVFFHYSYHSNFKYT
jgi:hypothetical protein